MTERDDPLGPHRRRLMGLAYRMLGSMTEAEDVLQDAYLRLAGVGKDTIRSTEAFLVTIVTRLCLDRLKSARAKREVYVGPWLPEPIADTDALSPETALELADDLSFALLLTLERLSGPERAAFLLHDVFDTSYADIAAALGKNEAACRQLATRARKAVRNEIPSRQASPEQHRALLAGFADAMSKGDAGALCALLAEDAVSYSDGGGVKQAALNPVIGADNIARFYVGIWTKAARQKLDVEIIPANINGAQGFVSYVDGEIDTTISIAVRDGRIEAIYAVRNPEKLGAMSAAGLN